VRTIDDDLLELGQRVQGFAGLHTDSSGDIVIRLTAAGDGPTAISIVRQWPSAAAIEQAARRSGHEARWKSAPASYTFADLKAWQQLADQLLGNGEVTSTDADELANKVRLGVVSRYAGQQATEWLVARGVPADAVLTGIETPDTPTDSLIDTVRPLRGGLETGTIGFGTCTYGFNATIGTAIGFVTNSHCTYVYGSDFPGLAGFTQNSSGPTLGSEMLDPTWWTCENGSRRCRYSDAAFIQFAQELPTPPYELGYIYKTMNYGWPVGTIGSRKINSADPRFKIISYEGFPYASTITVNSPVYRMSRTSGWTIHYVQQLCSNRTVSGTNITVLCQTIASGMARLGDSGGPIFNYEYCTPSDPFLPDGTSCVRLIGLNWGNTSSNQTIFSPFSAVQSELGLTSVF